MIMPLCCAHSKVCTRLGKLGVLQPTTCHVGGNS